MTHRDGVNAVITTYNMAYDRAHRLASGSHVNRFVSQNQTYAYDTAGQITSLVRTGGGASMESFSYDTSGNRTAATGVAYTNTNNNRIVSDGVFNYYYDDEGNLIRRIALVGGQPTGWTRDFQWDRKRPARPCVTINAAEQRRGPGRAACADERGPLRPWLLVRGLDRCGALQGGEKRCQEPIIDAQSAVAYSERHGTSAKSRRGWVCLSRAQSRQCADGDLRERRGLRSF
jgi:YD repeat-containing protein